MAVRHLNYVGTELPPIHDTSSSELGKFHVIKCSAEYSDAICSFNSMCGHFESSCQFSIVGNNQEPFTQVIESAHRDNVVVDSEVLQSLKYSDSALRIIMRSNTMSRLMKQPHFRTLLDRSVHACSRTNLNFGLVVNPDISSNYLAVNLNHTLRNQLLCHPPRGDAHSGQPFRESFGLFKFFNRLRVDEICNFQDLLGGFLSFGQKLDISFSLVRINKILIKPIKIAKLSLMFDQ